MNSYQKLKEENKRLKEDINKILKGDAEVIMRYEIKMSMESALMFAMSPAVLNVFDQWFGGLLPAIAKPYRLSLLDKKPIQ